MEQQVQYCTTSDGVRIAYASVGEGRPLIVVPGWVTHLHYTWAEEAQAFWKQLARHRRVVRYDGRGMGLSERDPADLSSDARVKDLNAVISVVGSESVELFGMSEGGPTAIVYAVRHPDKILKLILYGSYPRSPVTREDAQAVLPLVRRQWGMGSAALTAAFIPNSNPEQAAEFTRLQQIAMTGEMAANMLEEIHKTDVMQLLPSVTTPTLIIHRRGDRLHPVQLAQEMAAAIPGAQFELQEGEAFPPWMEDSHAVLRAVARFLGLPGFDEEAEQETVRLGGFATILFTDMEGSTTLADRLGDAAAQEVRRAHNEIVRGALAANAGSEIKHTGDGIMASFTTASSALDSAIAIQRGVAEYNVGAHGRAPLGVYVGLNAGEPIAEEGDLFGTSINLAARICDHAQAGQIVAADVVRQLAAGKQFLFSDLGETELRGFEDPVKLCGTCAGRRANQAGGEAPVRFSTTARGRPRKGRASISLRDLLSPYRLSSSAN